eukprot:SAG31_NODE_1121_length_9797_cov_16.183749_9_plen_46_part_00
MVEYLVQADVLAGIATAAYTFAYVVNKIPSDRQHCTVVVSLVPPK